MKHTNQKYINAICYALGLTSKSSEVPSELITQAMNWAAGINLGLGQSYQPVALMPVLGTVGKGKKAQRWFPPVELSLTKDFFPDENKPAYDQLQAQLDTFNNALKGADDLTLLTCLHYHASTLAVSEELPDISLYDFIKISAAILHCLENGNGSLRLAGGSISGIQSYLYDIVSKRAGKLLKGRSFYLQLLSDSLVEKFLEKFGLSDCHVVYSSGGGFYVLLPDNGQKTLDDFEDFKSEVIIAIYKKHKTSLYCEFAISEPFDEKVNIDGKDGIWDKLIQGLAKAKNQRLLHNTNMLADLLNFVDEGGDDLLDEKFTRDTVTNEQILRTDADEFDEDGNLVHKFTNAQKFLGEDLRDAKFWISSKICFSENCFPDPLEFFHLLCPHPEKNLPSDAIVSMINEPYPAARFVFYGGNQFPVFKKDYIDDSGELFKLGSPKTFDQLATGDGMDKLGILRMDVDGLGAIFSDHIGSPASFARYAAVSRSLDWFFKGYINTIHKDFFERTIIIYSGGDDLFIVGRWLETLEIACKIHKEFKAWTGGNLTISGGLAILPAKFPVMHGAELAGEKEDLAKGYTRNGVKEKNAIAFFDRALSWKYEMPLVFKLKEQLEWLLSKEGGNVDYSILKKIDIHAESRKLQEKDGASPRWIWNMLYDLSRFAEKQKKSETEKMIRQFASDCITNEPSKEKDCAVPFLFILQTAARWVELERRTRNKTENSQKESDND